jgi:acetylornithine/succinyldiaminopimelate/putrescine aminotransferase
MPSVLEAARDAGILVLRSGANILRIAPSFVISKEEITRGIELLKKVLKKYE